MKNQKPWRFTYLYIQSFISERICSNVFIFLFNEFICSFICSFDYSSKKLIGTLMKGWIHMNKWDPFRMDKLINEWEKSFWKFGNEFWRMKHE